MAKTVTHPIASVIIPAHQEASTIGRCLRALLADVRPGELQVVIAANGCTDGTAAVARTVAQHLGHEVVVLEHPQAAKPAAIRAAEVLDLVYPRVYLDADVECPTATIRALLRALEDGADLAVPTRMLDTTAATWWARAYFRAWSGFPWVREQLAGRGVIAVSRSLRDTFGDMPDVMADDRYITTRVPPDRAVVTSAGAVVRPASSLLDVVRVRRRVYQGNRAVDAATHDAALPRRSMYVARLLASPTSWPAVAVFLGVSVVAKVPWPSTGWARDSRRGGAA